MNPGSLILSAEMMLRYLKWREAADLIIKGVTLTIANKELTYDLARLREAIKTPKRELAARQQRRGGPAAADPRRDAHEHLGVRRRRHPAHG